MAGWGYLRKSLLYMELSDLFVKVEKRLKSAEKRVKVIEKEVKNNKDKATKEGVKCFINPWYIWSYVCFDLKFVKVVFLDFFGLFWEILDFFRLRRVRFGFVLHILDARFLNWVRFACFVSRRSLVESSRAGVCEIGFVLHKNGSLFLVRSSIGGFPLCFNVHSFWLIHSKPIGIGWSLRIC
jgi:hypothetical protein